VSGKGGRKLLEVASLKKLVCPHCDCIKDVIKYGKDRHRHQRFLCQTCCKTFTYIPPKPLEFWQKKKPVKGHKSTRGRAEIYDEVKGTKTLSLTKTAVQGLDRQAEALGISRSELVERIGRGVISLVIPSSEENYFRK
jgi:hypothetical protein